MAGECKFKYETDKLYLVLCVPHLLIPDPDPNKLYNIQLNHEFQIPEFSKPNHP